HKNALEHDVQIERFTGSMLEVPLQLSVVWINRDRRTRIKPIALRTASERHPRFRLRRSPVGQIQHGIVATGDPHFTARAILIRKIAPRVSAGVAGRCNGIEAPELFTALRIVSAQKAFFFLISLTAAKSLQHFAVDDEGAARIVVALSDFGVPHDFAVARVKRLYAISTREIKLVLVKRDAAHGDISAQVVFPNDFACCPIDRLDDSASIRKVNYSIMNDWSGLVRSAFIHR